MARLTARQMTQVRMPGAPAVPAKPAPKKVAVNVPPGGEASVRRIDNGLVVTTRDSNWNNRTETYVPDGSSLDLG